MDYILKNRGRGKTTALIERSSRTGERIVVETNARARYINQMAKELGKKIPEAISRSAFDTGRYDLVEDGILIDEIGDMLRQIFRCKVTAVTDTPDSVELDIGVAQDSNKQSKSTKDIYANKDDVQKLFEFIMSL